MKLHEMCLAGGGVFVAVVMLASACTGSSQGAQTPSVEPVETTPAAEETVVETPTEVPPTPDPADQVTDQQRIDAVVAQLAVDVGVDAIPSVFAYDVLDSAVNDEGTVTLTLCAWAGDSVFDQVRDSIYRTRVEADATITATHVTTPLAAGECLNTQLIESALDHINAYDEFTIDASEDPASFEDDPRRALLTESFAASSAGNLKPFAEDGFYFQDIRPAGAATETAVAELLWRRFGTDLGVFLEVAVCRDMAPSRGMFRDGVLFDNGRGEDDPGLHSIDSFQLRPDPSVQGGWLISGGKQIIWSDCFFAGTWIEGANIFQPRDMPFGVLDQ